MRLTYNDEAEKAVQKWMKKREVDEPECVRRLLRTGLSRQGGAARWENATGPLARFSVRQALAKVDWDADKAAVDEVLQKGLDAYMDARGLQKAEAVSRLLLSGAARFQAMENFDKREKTKDGLVKGARKAPGGNTTGWLARSKRRARAAGGVRARVAAKAKAAPHPAKEAAKKAREAERASAAKKAPPKPRKLSTLKKQQAAEAVQAAE